MGPRLCLRLVCLSLVAVLVFAAPRRIERRSPRSLDKSAELHARLRLLHKQIHDLVAEQERRNGGEGEEEGEEDTGNDVSGQRDVSRLRGGPEPRMTSERQKQELARTLDQLLRESLPEKSAMDTVNTAGEYLGDRYNKLREEDERHEVLNRELLSEARMPRRGEEKRQQEEEEEEETEAEEEEEGEKKQLQTIYNMLIKLYKEQHQGSGRGREEDEEEEEEEEEEEPETIKRKKTSLTPRRLGNGGSQFESRPNYLVDEGRFGEFVDTQEDTPSASDQYSDQLRHSVMNAVEGRLLQALQDAGDVGISVQDIIHDVQDKERRKQHLRLMESELDKLTGRD